MELNDLEKIRVEKVKRLRERGIEPYPTRANPTHTMQEALILLEAAEKAGETLPQGVTLAGRIRAMRPMGKLTFAQVEDGTGRLQFFFRINEVGEENLALLSSEYDLGDFIEGTGSLMRTRTGEPTLQVLSFRMLAKAISPLPAAKDEVVDGKVIHHAGLTDPETRYRQRYADLVVNPDVRKVFTARAAVVKTLRNFLDDHGFTEVETPILQPIYGGAAAQPFTTFHNQLKQNLYLRISFELYLKRLLVGMVDRVYEIGRDFRNEGVSFKHHPEFTQLEFYWAYADYLKVMELTEQMVAEVCDKVLGTRKVMYNGEELDFNPPWRRIEMRQGLLEVVGLDIYQHITAESLSAALHKKGIEHNPNLTRGKMIEGLTSDYLEPSFIQPTFMYDYPRDISPLAKSKPGDPNTVERFEGFVGGMELCNAFTELNDPFDQESRFLEMGRAYEKEDEERHPMDEDYLRAMAYGMPPNGGFGMGVDRLMMLLTDNHTIREVILFPHLREREEE